MDFCIWTTSSRQRHCLVYLSFWLLWVGTSGYIEEPRFVPTMTNITVREGEMAILPCSIHKLGTKQVAWRRTDENHFITVGTTTWIKDSTHTIEYKTLANDVTSWNLIIKNVRHRDAGQYECQITSTSDYTWHVKLNVVGPPVGKPAISVHGRKYVDQGEPIRLVCNATGGRHTPEDIDWFKDGDKIGRTKYSNIVVTKYRSMADKALISELLIDHSQTSDTGNYICRSSREDISSIRVTVLTADSTSNVKRSDIKLGQLGKPSDSSGSSGVCCTVITLLAMLAISQLFSSQLLTVVQSTAVLCLIIVDSFTFPLNINIIQAYAHTLVTLYSSSGVLLVPVLDYRCHKRVLYPLCHTSGCG